MSGNGVTEQQLSNIFDGFVQSLCKQLVAAGVSQDDSSRQQERVKTGMGHKWHCYNGKINYVPKDWQFPHVGVLICWQQWGIEDSVRNVPPLQNFILLSPEEMHGWKTRRHKAKRRPMRKIFLDINFLMN